MFSDVDKNSLLQGQIINIPKSWSKYINNTYNLSLMYPSLWAKINNLHYAGIDGYFRISALRTDEPLENICKTEAYHKLQPYGSNPNIVSDSVAGLNVCLVVPSADQPSDMKNQAALIIKYPKSLEIDDPAYNHLILYTDMEHLHDIKNSIMIENKNST